MTTTDNDGLRADSESIRQPNQTNDNNKSAAARWLGIAIGLISLVLVAYLLLSLALKSGNNETDTDTVQSSVEQAIAETPDNPLAPPVIPQPTRAPEIQPTTPVEPLPDLNNSDQEVQEAASKLNPALQWQDWITTDEAVRKLVVVMDNMSQGKIARKYLPIPKPEQTFVQRTDGIKSYLDPAGFERYTPYISLFENIDNDMTAVLYQRYSPLLEQAFSELGYPKRTFHDTLIEAFDELLDAPVIRQDIELVRPSVFYKFADPSLENQSAIHKQLIRMGPDNTLRLQEKIKQLKDALQRP